MTTSGKKESKAVAIHAAAATHTAAVGCGVASTVVFVDDDVRECCDPVVGAVSHVFRVLWRPGWREDTDPAEEVV